jgi:hypothetical protein
MAEELMRMEHWWTDGWAFGQEKICVFGENFVSATLIGYLTTGRNITLILSIL